MKKMASQCSKGCEMNRQDEDLYIRLMSGPANRLWVIVSCSNAEGKQFHPSGFQIEDEFTV